MEIITCKLNQLAVALVVIAGAYSLELCDFEVKIKQALLSEGFHRNLTYTIVFGGNSEGAGGAKEWLWSSCMLGVEQSLPAGVFVNPDELLDLSRLGKVNAFPRSRVDVEQSAEHSRNSVVYIVGRVVRRQAELWLPVHARYHKPQQNGGVALNIVPYPKLYLRCPDERLARCDHRPPPELPFLCTGTTHQCDMKEIPFQMLTGEVRWEVPVGARWQLPGVALGTGLVVALGSLYLLRALHLYNRNNAKKTA